MADHIDSPSGAFAARVGRGDAGWDARGVRRLIDTLAQHVLQWREDATRYELEALPNTAAVLRRCAQALDDTVAIPAQAPIVSLKEAAAWSGYSARHLARLIASYRVPNYGSRFRPRLSLADLPRKSKAGFGNSQ